MISKTAPLLTVHFFATETASEPVRDWLKEDVTPTERKVIGEDIKTVQFGWPLGMPIVGHIDGEIWEIRSGLPSRIARILFVLDGNAIVLLHGFIKKTQKTGKADIDLAKKRLRQLKQRNRSVP